MATMATTNLDTFVPPAELLTLSNYEIWKKYMKVNLKRRDLLEPIFRRYSHKDKPKPADGKPAVRLKSYSSQLNRDKKALEPILRPYSHKDNPADGITAVPLKSYSSELNRDNKALEAIQKSCGPEMLPLIHYAEFACEAWAWLEEASSNEDAKEGYKEMVETAKASRAKLKNVPEVNKVLTKRNYGKWREYMQNVLSSRYLWGVVDGTDKVGSAGYKMKNHYALIAIRVSCGKEMFKYIYDEGHAHNAWRKLKYKLQCNFLLGAAPSIQRIKLEYNLLGARAPSMQRIGLIDNIVDKTFFFCSFVSTYANFDTLKINNNLFSYFELLELADSPSIPPIFGDYESWRIHMENYLKDGDLWGFLETPNKLDSTKDEKALDAIKLYCGPHMQKFIWYADCAKSAWKELEAEQDEFAEVHEITEQSMLAEDKFSGIPEHDRVLTRSNYKEWSSYMKQYLRSLRLWSIVEKENGTDDTPESKPIKNACALRIIREACGRDMLPSIFGKEKASKAWKRLESVASMKQEDVYLRYSRVLHAVKTNRFRLKEQDMYEKNWRGANMFFRDFPEVLMAEITKDGDTALHVAVRLGRADFVRELLKLMNPAQLETTTKKGDTALSVAAQGYNNLEIAQMVVKKNPYLLQIENKDERSPLAIAAINGDEEAFRYLYQVTVPKEMLWLQSGIIGKRVSTVLTSAARIDAFDVVLEILIMLKKEKLAKYVFSRDDSNTNLLKVLAGKPSAFPSGNRFGLFAGFIYWLAGTKSNGIFLKALKAIVPGVTQPLDSKVKHHQTLKIVELICPLLRKYKPDELKASLVKDAIHLSTVNGIIEIFKSLIDTNPYLEDFIKHKERRGLFQIAIISRQKTIFRYISQMGQRNQHIPLLDKCKNNTLHCAGFWKQSPQLDKAHGPALEMQRELQWLEDVERVVPPSYREAVNKELQTPKALFSHHHRGLAEQGEKWMKETSQACMLVTTLIATVMFAAAFTLPGGSDQITGRSLIGKSAAFKVFIVSDAVSLFTSCTSILMFFSILTARYAEDDFLISLPRKMIIGLSTLFISIATMMTTFAATLVIVLRGEASWVYIPVFILASIPVLLFGLLQLPLFYHIVKSTYGRRIYRRIRSVLSWLVCRKNFSLSPLVCITCCRGDEVKFS
ncbi:hypothetical protein MKX03_035645 [Papaver bracteatum]|nr:hypothetical protein MKX03_035645 [Papaver bracteatum]